MQKLRPKEAGSNDEHAYRSEDVPGAVPSALPLCGLLFYVYFMSVLCVFHVCFVGEQTGVQIC